MIKSDYIYDMIADAKKGICKDKKEILRIVSPGTTLTVAHYQAYEGWRTEDKDILKLCDSGRLSVAHIQAKHGWTTEDEEILNLTSYYGIKVKNVIQQYQQIHKESKTDKFKINKQNSSLLPKAA